MAILFWPKKRYTCFCFQYITTQRIAVELRTVMYRGLFLGQFNIRPAVAASFAGARHSPAWLEECGRIERFALTWQDAVAYYFAWRRVKGRSGGAFG